MSKTGKRIGFAVAMVIGAAAMSAVSYGQAASVAVAAYIAATVIAGWLAVTHSHSFRDVLVEKSPDAVTGSFEPPASFSRLVGVIGAAMLVAFLWSYGLLTLVAMGTGGKQFVIEEKAAAAVSGQVNMFFYVGLALFAPYAANQLARILSVRGQTNSTPEQSEAEDQLDKAAQASPPPT